MLEYYAAMLVGAVAITYLVKSLLRFSFTRVQSPASNAITSLIILAAGTFWWGPAAAEDVGSEAGTDVGVEYVFMGYAPAAALWFIIDQRRWNKHKEAGQKRE